MTALPDAVRRRLESSIGRFQVVESVGGGCINPAVRVRHQGGDAFLKFNAAPPAGMFEVEAGGLRALGAAAAVLRVPRVLEVMEPESAGEPGALLLEWLQPAAPGGDHGERLGGGLAALHRARDGGWGWEGGGYIGPIPVNNEPTGRWADFWWERRIEPMLQRVRESGYTVGRHADWDALHRTLPDLLAPAEEDGPSLLHGDLWNGNVMSVQAEAGTAPALVDPAAYRGHREVDLAMADLFGGFPARFHDAYVEAWPLAPGWQRRRHVYQLFYLLVHVVLFGASYTARAERALRAALA
jgi:fructosamine-3-kinase